MTRKQEIEQQISKINSTVADKGRPIWSIHDFNRDIEACHQSLSRRVLCNLDQLPVLVIGDSQAVLRWQDQRVVARIDYSRARKYHQVVELSSRLLRTAMKDAAEKDPRLSPEKQPKRLLQEFYRELAREYKSWYGSLTGKHSADECDNQYAMQFLQTLLQITRDLLNHTSTFNAFMLYQEDLDRYRTNLERIADQYEDQAIASALEKIWLSMPERHDHTVYVFINGNKRLNAFHDQEALRKVLKGNAGAQYTTRIMRSRSPVASIDIAAWVSEKEADLLLQRMLLNESATLPKPARTNEFLNQLQRSQNSSRAQNAA